MLQHTNQLLDLCEEVTNTSCPLLSQLLFDGQCIRVVHVSLKREWQVAEVVKAFMDPAGKKKHASDRASQRQLCEAVHLSGRYVGDTDLVEYRTRFSDVLVEGEHELRDSQRLQTWVGVVLTNHFL